MRVTFHGVRGSFPVSHPKVSKVGGNTSCVSLTAPGAPTLIFDGGTGLRRCGRQLMKEEFGDGVGEACFLFSHTHWDHIQGLHVTSKPFYREGNKVQVVARGSHDKRLQQVFAGQVESDYFSYGLGGLKADLSWRGVQEGDTFEVGPYKISTVRLNHPGIALAYRVDYGEKSFIYMTDTAPYDDQLLGEGFHVRKPDTDPAILAQIETYGAQVEEFVKGADLLLYDTFFTLEQYKAQPALGSQHPRRGNPPRSPGRRPALLQLPPTTPRAWDDDLEARTRDYQRRLGGSDLEIGLAREGESVEL